MPCKTLETCFVAHQRLIGGGFICTLYKTFDSLISHREGSGLY